MPRARTGPVVLALVWLGSGFAAAQVPAPTDGDDRSGIELDAIDRATVRVLAVQGLETLEVAGRHHKRTLAVPEAGHGSGVVIGDGRVVLTAGHVVDGAHHLAVLAPGQGRAQPAAVAYRDKALDFAVVVVPEPLPNRFSLDSARPRRLRVREQVHAVGYPLDAKRTLPQSSRGIVAGLLDDGSIQLDISLNPGNSGGPLIDDRSRMLGIVVARGRLEEGVQGIGVAVPIGPIVEAYGRLQHGDELEEARRRAGAVHTDQTVLVHLLVHVGVLGVLEEITAWLDQRSDAKHTSEIVDRARKSSSPRLKLLAAAHCWNAYVVVMERAGGYLSPEQMPEGPERTLAHKMRGWAKHLVLDAVRATPELRRESPLVDHVMGGGIEGPTDASEIQSDLVTPTEGPSPGRRVGRFVFESLAGEVGLWLAAFAVAWVAPECVDLHCSTAPELVTALALAIGATAGVNLAGRVGRGRGSYWMALLGSTLGALAAFGIAQGANEEVSVVGAATLPPLSGALLYELTWEPPGPHWGARLSPLPGGATLLVSGTF